MNLITRCIVTHRLAATTLSAGFVSSLCNQNQFSKKFIILKKYIKKEIILYMDRVQYFVLHCLVEYRTLRLPQLKTAGGGGRGEDVCF